MNLAPLKYGACKPLLGNMGSVVESSEVSEQLDSRQNLPASTLTDDGVQDMLILAERLREANGGVLDDAAILAVSEATGAPPEYVRLAIKLRPHKRKGSVTDKVRDTFLTLEPDTRRHVVSATLATAMAAAVSFGSWTGDTSGLYGTLSILIVTGSLYNVSVSKDSRTAAIAGAIFGCILFVALAIFGLFLKLQGVSEFLLIPSALGGALAGLILQRIVDAYRGRLGLNDPVKERQDLLKQLVDLQDKLRSGEQACTFLSIDIVGSTRMKQAADPLSVEFTFNEYHRFVEMIAKRYGGRLHSTAGDGVTLAFDQAQQAFGAARTIQAGLIELNTFRNKIGVPIALRCGIHSGTIMAPDATDVTSVNFASVIDIAAHMQKVCPPGGIAISDAAVRQMPGGSTAVNGQPVQIESTSGLIWMPRATPALTSMPPALPVEPA